MCRRSLYGAVLLLGSGLVGGAGRAAGQPGGPPAPTASVRATPAATLSLEVLAPETIVPEEPWTFEIVVRNPGATAATAVGVEQLIPTGGRLVLTEPRAETHDNRLRWNLGALEAGGERRLRAELQAPDPVELPAPTVSFALASTHRAQSARRPFVVTVTGPDTVKRGDKVKFHIQVANNGAEPIHHVLVRDQLPDGFYLPQGSFVEADIGTLKAGEVKTVPLEVTAARPGRWNNEVSALADGDLKAEARMTVTVVEPALGQGDAATPTLLLELAAHEDTLRVDAETTYEVHVANQGGTAARNLSLTVRLPEGLTLVRGEGPSPARQTPQEATFAPLPQLRPRSDAVYRIRVRGRHPGDWRWHIELSSDGTTKKLLEEVSVRVTDVQGPSRRLLDSPH